MYTETIRQWATDTRRTGFIDNADGIGEVGLESAEAGRRLAARFTLKIELDQLVDLAYGLYWQTTCVLPKEEVARKDFSSNPVGLGPFKFVKWRKGSELVLEKNPKYYKPRLPYLDKLVFYG